MNNVVPLFRASVPRARGIRLYVDAFGFPTARVPVLGAIGVRKDHHFQTVAEARAYAAAQSDAHGWSITDEIDDTGRAA